MRIVTRARTVRKRIKALRGAGLVRRAAISALPALKNVPNRPIWKGMDRLRRVASPTVTVDESGLAGLVATLWRMQEDLEQVLYRLGHQQLILRSGDVRWLSRVDDELTQALAEVQHNEVLRAIEVDEISTRLGLACDTSLRQIAEMASPPWSDILLDHRARLSQLQDEITAMTEENRRLLQAGADAAREALGRVGGEVGGTYRADGRVAHKPSGPVLLDRQA